MTGSFLRGIGVTVVTIVLTAAPAFAQTASPSPSTPSLLPMPTATHSWTYFMAIATIGIAGLTLVMAALGYLLQAPGFRRGERPGRPAPPTQAS